MTAWSTYADKWSYSPLPLAGWANRYLRLRASQTEARV